MSDVTRILSSMEDGDPKAAEELLPLLYTELRRIAAAKMTRELCGQTLHPTSLGQTQPRPAHGSGRVLPPWTNVESAIQA